MNWTDDFPVAKPAAPAPEAPQPKPKRRPKPADHPVLTIVPRIPYQAQPRIPLDLATAIAIACSVAALVLGFTAGSVYRVNIDHPTTSKP